jgi:flagellar protein FliS
MNRTRDGAAAYRKIGLETEAQSASPHRLVLMLFEGAQLAVANAQHHMRAGHIAEKGQSISRAIEIIASGLQSSLDLESGGELAERLEALYEYMGQRLLHANLHNDQAALTEVVQLLGELKGAWAEIAEDPLVTQNGLKDSTTP